MEILIPISDQKISTFLGKLKQVWRVNRKTSLGMILQEIKTLCDNPYTEISDLDNNMLEQGADRYLVQEHRDHPDRFVQAELETTAEEAEAKLKIEQAKTKKPFKEMTPEEKKTFRVANIKRAREIKANKKVGVTETPAPVVIPQTTPVAEPNPKVADIDKIPEASLPVVEAKGQNPV